MNNVQSPDLQFIEYIIAGLAYWQKRTAHLDDQAIHDLDIECRNLHRIVRYGLVLPQTWHDTAVVILQSFFFIERHGYWREWMPVLEKAITWCDDKHVLLKFRLLNQLGQLLRLMQQLAPALEAHKEAETIAQGLGDERMLAESHSNLSELCLRQRQYDEAERYGLSALSLFLKLDAAERWRASTLSTLGELARFRGDWPLAEERLSQAIAYWRFLDEPLRIARTLNDLAVTSIAAKKFEQAEQCLTEAARLLEPTVSELDKVMIQINIGLLHFRQENWTEAEAAFRKADSAYLRRSPHIYYRALVANNLGNVLLKQKKLAEAAAYLEDASSIWRQTNDNLELANTLGTLAETMAEQQQYTVALPLYEEALALLSAYPDDAWATKLQEKFTQQRNKI